MDSYNTCMTVSDYNEDAQDYIYYDLIATCIDDGRSVCEGNIICTETCPSSNTGTCDGDCYETNHTVPGMYDCDDYRANFTGMDVGFTDLENASFLTILWM